MLSASSEASSDIIIDSELKCGSIGSMLRCVGAAATDDEPFRYEFAAPLGT